MFKSGFVTIVGRPNAGKSTFINQVMGQKIAITSDKPQTTRNNIQAIYTKDDSQVILIDTPGIHKPKHSLGSFMTSQAIQTLKSVDLVCYMVDSTQDFGKGDEFMIQLLEDIKTPVFLLVNKVDLITDIERLKRKIDKFKSLYDFEGVFTISAKRGDHLEKIIDDIVYMLPEGPLYYPKDQTTSYPEKFIMSEIIREKVIRLTEEEVPHSIMCVIEYMDQDETFDHMINIHASIYVERKSQKGIIIGKNGQMIKKIGTYARKDILNLLGVKVFLDLHVKVEKNWRNKPHLLHRFGYDESGN
jgi:GTP-binding protein Era